MNTTIRKSQSATKGQVMLLTTLVLSGVVLAAITVAGLLMLYQIRQAGNATQSAMAIFAADAGLEHELYQFLGADCAYPAPTFTNGASVEAETVIENNNLVINANGRGGRTFRSFRLNLGSYASATPPCQ